MSLEQITSGKSVPDIINVIIEVPKGSAPVKYEMCKDSGFMFVDRFIATSMYYPYNYGFIPHTLSGDGDPCDVLVITKEPVISGCVIPARPIGVLLMEDESGQDEKIIAVPTDKIDPYFTNIKSYKDLNQTACIAKIEHFFTHYKDLEKGKWVKIIGWEDIEKAKSLIMEAVERAKHK